MSIKGVYVESAYSLRRNTNPHFDIVSLHNRAVKNRQLVAAVQFLKRARRVGDSIKTESPPSIVIACPVTHAASSEQSHKAP